MAIQSAGLCIFPWDFVDEGLDEVLGFVGGLGITRLYLASVYHAGWFLHPHNPRRKTHMLDDGAAYFHATESRYAEGPIKPVVARMCAETDWFGAICDRASGAGLEMTAWTVCLHSTRLGLLHPECTIHNVFGDGYPHALTPAHPACRAYLRGLIGDLSENYPLHSIFLEAPNYRGRLHGGTWVSGHHHARDGVHLRDLELSLLDLSFNPADVDAADESGVDTESLRAAIRDHLERYFAAAPDVPDDLPETIDEFRSRTPALAGYEAHFRRTEESLLVELNEAASPHGVKLIGSGKRVDIALAGVYGEPAERAAEITRDAKAGLAPHQQLSVAVRLGFTSPGMGTPILTERQLCDVTRAIDENGADGIVYYNYSESPRRPIEWIGPALQSVGFGGRD